MFQTHRRGGGGGGGEGGRGGMGGQGTEREGNFFFSRPINHEGRERERERVTSSFFTPNQPRGDR